MKYVFLGFTLLSIMSRIDFTTFKSSEDLLFGT
jgi:hypothetical protein